MVLFSFVALAQIRGYSHFVGGNFNRAGYRNSPNGFAAWDPTNKRYVDMSYATFLDASGLPATISDITPAGNGE